MTTSASAAAPMDVRIRLAHAAVQFVVESVGARALHLKGYALDPSLVWPGRVGSDVDLLVAPADIAPVVQALRSAGWEHYTGFEAGSAFEHAVTMWHDTFGYVDLHRFFPGIGLSPEAAFEALWSQHGSAEIGGHLVPVPHVDAQALVLVLHAGRSEGGPRARRDLQTAWSARTEEERARLLALVERLQAEVGFAAATGGLERYRDRPEYDLWRVASRGGTRIDEWRARIKAAPTWRAKAALMARAPLVNIEHLQATLGRRATASDIAREFVARPLRGAKEEWRRRRGGRS